MHPRQVAMRWLAVQLLQGHTEPPGSKPASEAVQAHFGNKKIKERGEGFCPISLCSTRNFELKRERTAPRPHPLGNPCFLLSTVARLYIQVDHSLNTAPKSDGVKAERAGTNHAGCTENLRVGGCSYR